LTFKGSYGKGSVDARIDIDNLNLSALEGIVPDVSNLKGSVKSGIEIAGPLKDPQINGEMNITGLEFKPDLFKTPFTGGNASVRFDKQHVFIDSFSIRKDKAYGHASGFISIEKGQIFDIDFSAG